MMILIFCTLDKTTSRIQQGLPGPAYDYRNDQIVFSQGQVADAVFYIQQGKVKLTVVSEQGKEAVVAILGPGHFFGEG